MSKAQPQYSHGYAEEYTQKITHTLTLRTDTDKKTTVCDTTHMSQTKFSLIITVKDDATALTELLTSIESQTHALDEVIITVAPSSDDTLSVAKNWKPKKTYKKVLELEPNATRSTGRNAGAEVATGSIVCFTDAGCVLSPSWFEKIIHAFSLPETKLVSGFTTSTKNSPLEEIQGAFTLVSLARTGKHPLPATRNMAVKKDIFEAVGPFRDELNYAEDFEWSRRAKAKGIVSTFVPDAKVWWKPRQSWYEFWLMIFKLTAGDMQAQTWRWGHLSMWGRYLLLLLLSWGVWKFSDNLWLAVGIFLLLWSFYVLAKMTKFAFTHRASYAYLPLAQALTDSAVLTGTLAGVLKIWQDLKAKRKALSA